MTSPRARSRAHLLLAAVVSVSALTACDVYVERPCAEGEDPVYALDNPTGMHCLPQGRPEPPGWARYPPGRVPQEVGDRYYRSWPLGTDYPWAEEVGDETRERARQLRRRSRQ